MTGLRLILNCLLIVVTTAATCPGNEPSGSVANVPMPVGAEGPPTNAPGAANTSKSNERLREGTKLVDVIGTFQSAGGDSISFSREGGRESFRVLENLALQRIGQALENNLGGRQWIVSGVITEYRGANYLLLTKAVVRLQEGDGASQ